MSPPPVEPPAAGPRIVVVPPSGWPALALDELWRYRDLLWILSLRDVHVKYKQAVLGIVWVILQPLATAAMFTVIFGRFLKLPSDGKPYLLFSFTGMVVWTFFAASLSACTNSLVGNAGLIGKVYFPRLVIPAAAVLAAVPDMLVGLCVLAGVMVWYGFFPPWLAALAVPLLALLAGLISLGAGLWLSALNVTYRDVRYAVPFLIQFWMFATPIVYPLSAVPVQSRWIMELNPITGVIEGMRSALLGTPWPSRALAVSASAAVVLLVFGLVYFRRTERTFADVI